METETKTEATEVKTAEVTEVKPEAKTEEKVESQTLTLTQEELNEKIAEAVTKRLARVKDDAINTAVAEKTRTAEERVKALEDELQQIKTDKKIVELSAALSVDADLLRESGLTGDKLDAFAKKISEKQKELLAGVSTRVNGAALSATRVNGTTKSVAEIVSEQRAKRKNKR